jgi:Fe-S-cluster-containing dehydrogenase component
MLPACVSTCPCRANFFGDLDDAEALLYKMMKAHKVKVLKSVGSGGKEKLTFTSLKGKSAEEIAKMVGYPGKTPIFADTAAAKPRVFYILS